jgi:hypothetical protein
MKNFRGSALAAGVGTPESAPHELLGSSLHFYLGYKHRDCVRECMRPSPETFAVRTYNYVLEGLVRANSGLGTIHCSGA